MKQGGGNSCWSLAKVPVSLASQPTCLPWGVSSKILPRGALTGEGGAIFCDEGRHQWSRGVLACSQSEERSWRQVESR